MPRMCLTCNMPHVQSQVLYMYYKANHRPATLLTTRPMCIYGLLPGLADLDVLKTTMKCQLSRGARANCQHCANLRALKTTIKGQLSREYLPYYLQGFIMTSNCPMERLYIDQIVYIWRAHNVHKMSIVKLYLITTICAHASYDVYENM